MERLTERLENNERIVRINGTYGDAMRKLADYEDAEEQGRVINLPLTNGDTVYEISNDCTFVREQTISGFVISKQYGTFICLGDRMRPVNDAYFGRVVFRTRKEAEAKLAEINKEG